MIHNAQHVAEVVNVARFVAPGIAASLLGVSRTTLIRWEAEGKISPRRLFGGHRRYLLSELRSVLSTESQENRS
jgi:excisionase family DNA binding protein